MARGKMFRGKCPGALTNTRRPMCNVHVHRDVSDNFTRSCCVRETKACVSNRRIGVKMYFNEIAGRYLYSCRNL